MSKDWCKDIKEMHEHYSVHKAIEKLTAPQLVEFLKFRIKFLREELTELEDSASPDDAIDALIDLCVVAIGTLDAFGVDSNKAWDEVLKANMAKVTGIKPSRPNPLGLPDLIKPEGWVGPSHVDNRSLLDFVYLETWSRAPERRIRYIDVGNLPKIEAEQYVQDIMTKHKNRVNNASTGEVKDTEK